jgi:DNA processing protein
MEHLYWYWLSNIEGIGLITIHKMMELCHDPKEIFRCNSRCFVGILNNKQLGILDSAKRSLEVRKSEYNDLMQKEVVFIPYGSTEYPKQLVEIHQAPIGLYRKGNVIPVDQKKVTIIGARDCTIQGMMLAEYFGNQLAKAGVCVVSGLAKGIDGNAHKGALNAKKDEQGLAGGNLGILGCGINIRYPLDNYHLFEEMEQYGTILSEYNWNVQPRRHQFPMRNRIMSGISDAILVVEAKERSGSLITVDYGLEQGKEIFAIPGRITDKLSIGCNKLIQQGATPVISPSDILKFLNVKEEKISQNRDGRKKENKILLETNEKLVYSCLGFEPKFIDTIIEETHLPVQEVLSVLFRLECKGSIKQVINHYYIKTEIELG